MGVGGLASLHCLALLAAETGPAQHIDSEHVALFSLICDCRKATAWLITIILYVEVK